MQSGGNPVVKYTWFGRTEPTEYQGPCALTFLGGAWGGNGLVPLCRPPFRNFVHGAILYREECKESGSDPAKAFGRGVPEGLGNCVLTPAEPA